MSKTREQLEEQIRVEERLKEERRISDTCYAPMIIKVIVYTGVGIVLTTVVAALLSKIIL